MKQLYSAKKIDERIGNAKIAAASRTPEEAQEAGQRMARVVALIETAQAQQAQVQTRTQTATA